MKGNIKRLYLSIIYRYGLRGQFKWTSPGQIRSDGTLNFMIELLFFVSVTQNKVLEIIT